MTGRRSGRNVIGIGFVLAVAACSSADSEGVASEPSVAIDVTVRPTAPPEPTAVAESVQPTESVPGVDVLVIDEAVGHHTRFGALTYTIERMVVTNDLDSLGYTEDELPLPIARPAPPVVVVEIAVENPLPVAARRASGVTLMTLHQGMAAAGASNNDVEVPAESTVVVPYLMWAPNLPPFELDSYDEAYVLFTPSTNVSTATTAIPVLDAETYDLPAVMHPLDGPTLTGGDATVAFTSVSASLDGVHHVVAGDEYPAERRALDQHAWLVFGVDVTCTGPLACDPGFELPLIGIEVDGARAEIDPGRSGFPAGMIDSHATSSTFVELEVHRGATYSLVLGDPASPDTVQRVPLDVAADIDALISAAGEHSCAC
jgi:hypothetical protein